MFKVTIKPQWQVQAPSGEPALLRRVELLVGIHETGSLARACALANLSYRYAWGMLQTGEKTLGAALIEAQRGSGTRLKSRATRSTLITMPRTRLPAQHNWDFLKECIII